MKPIPPIAPVFTHRYETIAFIAFTLLSLIAPLATAQFVSEEKRYQSVPWALGDYTFMREQIFEDERPIDILFLGSSAIWTGVNPVLVEQMLEQHVARDATVVNFGVAWEGHDAAYYVLRDLLRRRQVRVVVLGSPSGTRAAPHRVTPYLLDLDRDAAFLKTFPFASIATFYAAAVLGTPRQFVGLLRPNGGLAADKRTKHAVSRQGLGQHYDTLVPPGSSVPPAVAHEVSSDLGDALLSHGNPQIRQTESSPHQEKVLRAILTLCEQSGARLVLLRMPRQDDRDSSVTLPSGELLGGRLQVIAPHARLAALPAAERARYFRDPGHLNYQGSLLFTRDAMPALLEVYEDRPH